MSNHVILALDRHTPPPGQCLKVLDYRGLGLKCTHSKLSLHAVIALDRRTPPRSQQPLDLGFSNVRYQSLSSGTYG